MQVNPDGSHLDTHPKRRQEDWPEWVGPSWGNAISRSEIVGPYAHLGGAYWVIAEGNDEKAVDAEVKRLITEAIRLHGAGSPPMGG